MNKNKYRKYYYLFLILAWIGLLTPVGIWIGMNFDKYIIQKSGFTVSVGGILAVLYIILLLKYGLKKFGKIFWMTFLLIIVICLDTIIADALPLTFFTWIGVVLYTILEMPAKFFKKKLETYVNEEIRESARQSAKNQKEQPKRRIVIKRNDNGRC